ncbi:SDR family oxidoreductase [Snodgrassella gandavensis]|uniref:SDR family oxidoreductase n=1 Tax=Snodgrassella gandavensis TaxID=2946698 RepID=UPI0023B27C50|nr:SDR family oxidoreductase [Snodgrassella gandavensis]
MNIFITGAESGIGNEIAQLALLQGHKVFATYLVEKNINKLDSENVFIYKLDVTDPSKIKDVALIAKKELDFIDVLINVAGVSYFNNPVSTTDEEWRNTLDVNVSGYFFLTRELLPLLKESQPPILLICHLSGD